MSRWLNRPDCRIAMFMIVAGLTAALSPFIINREYVREHSIDQVGLPCRIDYRSQHDGEHELSIAVKTDVNDRWRRMWGLDGDQPVIRVHCRVANVRSGAVLWDEDMSRSNIRLWRTDTPHGFSVPLALLDFEAKANYNVTITLHGPADTVSATTPQLAIGIPKDARVYDIVGTKLLFWGGVFVAMIGTIMVLLTTSRVSGDAGGPGSAGGAHSTTPPGIL